MQNLIKRSDVAGLVRKLRRQDIRIVFTNGVFDILHRGHVEYLAAARSLGDVLIVGLNSDASARRLKGVGRPIQKLRDRAAILLALKAVDYVVAFGEDTPDKLIGVVRPDVLVKGADYKTSEIVGARFVQSYGGVIRRIRLVRGRSTSDILRKLKQ